MTDAAAAIAILKATTWFGKCSDDLLQSLASKLTKVQAEEGYIFLHEGDVVDKFMILETGTLARTKLHVVGEGSAARENLRASLRNLKPAEVSGTLKENAILVDTLEGHGRVTGLLHTIQDESKAYATVAASDGPATVWVMSHDDFRAILTSNTEFMFDIMGSMARELRTGSKSVRTLMSQLKTGGASGSATDEKSLRVLCYDTTSWVSDAFQPAIDAYNQGTTKDGFQISMDFTTERLGPNTATFAAGYEAVCTFVNDTADADTMQTLSRLGVTMIAQRAAGFDRIDTKAARAFGMTVARVPAYSPYAVAEMAIALLMAVNRKTSRASARVRMANFALDGGLLGMDIHGKTVGVMGTGKIGQILCNIVKGFGAKLICFDVFQSEAVKQAGGVYVTQEEIYAQSDVLFLMMPLLPATKHTINMEVLPKLKKGVILINTSRGGLVDTKAVLEGLETKIISGYGADVYENEAQYFFQDWSAKNIEDHTLLALLAQPGVILTAHQAFFTKEAVDKITDTTVENLVAFKSGKTGYDHPNNCIPKEE